MGELLIAAPRLQRLSLPGLDTTTMDVLRLDEVHPVVSGNKWYKLQVYLSEAKRLGKKRLVSFGGAYSNHLVATSAAAAACGMQSIGIVRGRETDPRTPTLTDALELGMQLLFASPEVYRKKDTQEILTLQPDDLLIPEGGYGPEGAAGAETILKDIDLRSYTHILAAVGTGTMLAGLIRAASGDTKVIGIPVLKNEGSIAGEINALLPEHLHQQYRLIHLYHFGGYAKHPSPLIQFMNEWFETTGIPSDIVYTGKLFFAAKDLAALNYFGEGARVLLIHSGGLQGNCSLKKGTLIF